MFLRCLLVKPRVQNQGYSQLKISRMIIAIELIEFLLEICDRC